MQRLLLTSVVVHCIDAIICDSPCGWLSHLRLSTVQQSLCLARLNPNPGSSLARGLMLFVPRDMRWPLGHGHQPDSNTQCVNLTTSGPGRCADTIPLCGWWQQLLLARPA